VCIFVHFGLSAKLRGLEWVISSIEKQHTDTTNQENHLPSNASSLGILQFCSPSPMVTPGGWRVGVLGLNPVSRGVGEVRGRAARGTLMMFARGSRFSPILLASNPALGREKAKGGKGR
jgi:hypothetical protein